MLNSKTYKYVVAIISARGEQKIEPTSMKKMKYILILIFCIYQPYALADGEENMQPVISEQIDEPVAGDITPEHVYGLLTVVTEDVNELALEMGKTIVTNNIFRVKNAQPREVFFQATNLYRKIDRLKYELTFQSSDNPEIPAGNIAPKDVLKVLNMARMRVHDIKKVF